jgi:DnaJ family protein C protein 8
MSKVLRHGAAILPGTSQEQIDRVLQVNYQWKNLNPYDVLQLDIDATEEDIKLRYRKLSTLVHPDKCLTIDNAREAFEEVSGF